MAERYHLKLFKPIGAASAVVEVWSGETLIAELFAPDGAARRLFVRDNGIDWGQLQALAVRMSAVLNEADQEMRDGREQLGEA